MCYNKISNKLFYNENKQGLIKNISDDKVLLIMNLFYQWEDRRSVIRFTIKDLLESCGYKFSSKNNSITKNFKEILIQLSDAKAIELLDDIKLADAKANDLLKVKLSLDMSKNYFQLEENEFNKIMTYNKEKIDNVKLLTLFSYLKCRMYKNADVEIDGKLRPWDIQCDGGHAEYCNPSYATICRDLNITDAIITKYIKILWDINLIRYNDNTDVKFYYDYNGNKVIKNIPNVYVMYNDCQEVWETNIKEGIKLYKKYIASTGGIFINKKNQNNYSLNGKKGALVKKVNSGKATEEEIKQLENINIVTSSEYDKKQQLISIIDREQTTLSEYYDVNNNDEECEKYYALELSLGLTDTHDNLLVDIEYYKWIISNYDCNKHDYYKNCVSKHINESSSKVVVQEPSFLKHIRKIEKVDIDLSKPPVVDNWGGCDPFEGMTTDEQLAMLDAL